MATATTTEGLPRVRRSMPARRRPLSRKQRIAEAKEREVAARRELGLALARMEWTYALAVRRFEEFDDYLAAVRARLRHAG